MHRVVAVHLEEALQGSIAVSDDVVKLVETVLSGRWNMARVLNDRYKNLR